jgi:hemerythrin
MTMNNETWHIEWSEAMSVGIDEIDDDERNFIKLIDAFNQSVANRMDITEVRKRLQDIVDDTERHFSNEETLLRGRRYPNVGEHAIKHVALKKLIRLTLSESGSYGTDYEWITAGLKIKNELIAHVLNDDQVYAKHFWNWRSTGAPEPDQSN